MKTEKVVLGALAGTAAMTLFSYLLAGKKSKNFKEPKLLGEMVNKVFPKAEKTGAQVSGWLMHAATGLIFAAVYRKLLQKADFRRNVPNVVFIGVVTGVAGIIIWKLTFSLHPDPPKIHFSKFYQHLILAHIVFSTTTLSFMDENNLPAEKRWIDK